MRTFLVTGITGTLGKSVSLLLSEEGHKVIGFSRDEMKQAALLKESRRVLYLGDVRDRDRVLEASRGVDAIFHFAALKHVDLLEANPEESIETNIRGTENILHAQRIHGIRRVIFTSTDKAAYPVNTYGMSKAISEKLVLRNPDNVVCRYGNVAASRGSFIPNLVRSLVKENVAHITDPNMTRFWISIDEASKFVSSFWRESCEGGLKIPTMKACSIKLLTETIAGVLNIPSYHTHYMGHRAGEKIHECLRTSYEGEEVHSNSCEQFTHEQLASLLRPLVEQIRASL